MCNRILVLENCRLNILLPLWNEIIFGELQAWNKRHNLFSLYHYYNLFLFLVFLRVVFCSYFFFYSLNTGCDNKDVIEKRPRSYFIRALSRHCVNACVNWERSPIYTYIVWQENMRYFRLLHVNIWCSMIFAIRYYGCECHISCVYMCVLSTCRRSNIHTSMCCSTSFSLSFQTQNAAEMILLIFIITKKNRSSKSV